MNMAGYFQSGMCAPHNTSQYIINQHEYACRIEEKEPEEVSEGSVNHSTVDGDFPLTDPPIPRPRKMKAHQQKRKRKKRTTHSRPPRLEMPR